MRRERDSFQAWVKARGIRRFDKYTTSELYRKYLDWHGGLVFPNSERYVKLNAADFEHFLLSHIGPKLQDTPSKPKKKEPKLNSPPKRKKAKKPEKEKKVPDGVGEWDMSEADVFAQIKDYTRRVAEGKDNAFILLGDAGAGKTTTVRRVLEEVLGPESKARIFSDRNDRPNSGGGWIEGPVKIGPQSLYMTLYRENGKVILLDECKSIFESSDSVEVLKKVLDSKPKRKISYGARPIRISNITRSGEDYFIPTEFEFTGRVVFVSNLYFHQVNQALLSRALVCNVDLTPEQMLGRIQRLMPDLSPKTASPHVKNEVLEFLKEVSYLYNKLDLRTFEQAVFERVRSPENWKRRVAQSLRLKSKH